MCQKNLGNILTVYYTFYFEVLVLNGKKGKNKRENRLAQ
jgi:hypothetical protein